MCYNEFMKISDVNKKYKNKWVLAEVLKQDKLNQPVDVKPIMASKDRDEIYDKIATLPRGEDKLYTSLFTGKMTGVYIFYVNTKA